MTRCPRVQMFFFFLGGSINVMFPGAESWSYGLSARIKTKALHQLPPNMSDCERRVLNSQRLPSGRWRRWCRSSGQLGPSQATPMKSANIPFICSPSAISHGRADQSQRVGRLHVNPASARTDIHKPEWNMKYQVSTNVCTCKKKRGEKREKKEDEEESQAKEGFHTG